MKSMRTLPGLSVAAVFLGFCLCVPAAPQDGPRVGQASSLPVVPADDRFRVSTNLVTVDVLVTAKKGRIVRDLGPADFLILEDDVPQAIQFFYRTADRPSPAGPFAAAEEAPAVAAPAVPEVETSNLIILLLDYSTTILANQKLVRDGARKYIRTTLKPDDTVAICAFDSGLHVLQNPTRDREKLLAALEYSGSRGDAVAGERAAISTGASQAIEAQKALGVQIGSLLGAAASGAPSAAVAPALAMAQAQMDMARAAELRYYALKSAFDDQLSRSILLGIQALADSLRAFPGRKSLVLLSQGFVVPPNVRKILDAALESSVRANTAIYSIDARGLVSEKQLFQTTELESISALQNGTRTRVVNGESQFDRAAMIGTDQEESLLRYLSNATGGLYLRNSNDLSRGLRAIDEDIHARYILAYTSTNKKTDGRFRAIRVQAREAGLKVRARRGYFAAGR